MTKPCCWPRSSARYQLRTAPRRNLRRQTHPIIFGEPMEWVGLLVKANEHIARSEIRRRLELRDRPSKPRPPRPAPWTANPLEWIADGDSAWAPPRSVLEGRYCWVPFCRIKRSHRAPADLRDLVWRRRNSSGPMRRGLGATFPGRYPQPKNHPTARSVSPRPPG